MLEIVEFAEETEKETFDCDESGCPVTDLDDFESFFSELATCGRYIGESGHYCDDHYPRCYCRDCDS